jgi:DNA-binding response OmpR family regulator
MNAKVLVVDDEWDMLELLGTQFRAEGYEVRTAASGIQALNEARGFLPDLIVLDLMLGDLDGLSICELLRAQPSTSDIPVIIITAMGGMIPRFHALESGATDYLAKPFSPRDLLRRAETIIEARLIAQVQNMEYTDNPGLNGRI